MPNFHAENIFGPKELLTASEKVARKKEYYRQHKTTEAFKVKMVKQNAFLKAKRDREREEKIAAGTYRPPGYKPKHVGCDTLAMEWLVANGFREAHETGCRPMPPAPTNPVRSGEYHLPDLNFRVRHALDW
ncbi:MAG: hypothetical protein WCC64_05655 [Aliidongia sp.]